MMVLLSLSGCVSLDTFVFGGVHCSNVGPETCTDDPWDSVCLTCDEPYDWTLPYPWFDTMLEPGQSVRPIPDASITRTVVPSADGLAELDTYLVASHGEVPELAATTILYHHGTSFGIEHYLPRLRVLHELGYAVLVWDYRGYGKTNPATYPTPEQFLADAATVRDFADTVVVDPGRLVIYGYSLGAVPAVEAALEHPGCTLVLEAPFTSIEAIAAAGSGAGLPESYLSAGLFDNIEKIRDYRDPLFAMVGSEDGRFGPEDVARIVDNSGGPSDLWILPGVEHGISNGGVVEAGMTSYGDHLAAFYVAIAPACIL